MLTRTIFSQSRKLISGTTLLGLTIALSACGGGGSSSGASSSNSSSNGVTSFAATPSVIDFGKTILGESIEGAVTIENTGTLSFDLSVVDLQEGFTATNDCGELQPGDECALLFEFSPTEQKVYSSSVTLAANSNQSSLTLQGEGQGLNVEILNFQQSCATSEVVADLGVTAANGLPVSGIRAENLTVLLNGEEVDLPEGLTVINEPTPIAVGILLDWSLSLEDFRPQLLDATSRFIESLEPVDRAGLYRFAEGIDWETSQALTDADAAGTQALLDSLYKELDTTNQGSSIWTPVNTVSFRLLEEAIERRIMILLTDGQNNRGLSFEELKTNLESRGIQVYTIGYGDLDPSPLQALSNATGGLFFSNPVADGLNEAFESIGLVITESYSFKIVAPDSGELTVVVTDDSGRIGEDVKGIPQCP